MRGWGCGQEGIYEEKYDLVNPVNFPFKTPNPTFISEAIYGIEKKSCPLSWGGELGETVLFIANLMCMYVTE